MRVLRMMVPVSCTHSAKYEAPRRRGHLSPICSASVLEVVLYQPAHPWRLIID